MDTLIEMPFGINIALLKRFPLGWLTRGLRWTVCHANFSRIQPPNFVN